MKKGSKGSGPSLLFQRSPYERGSAVPLFLMVVFIALVLIFAILRTTFTTERTIQHQSSADASVLAGANLEAIALDANAVFNILDLVLHGLEAGTLTVSTVLGVPLAVSIIFTPEGLSILSTGLEIADQLYQFNENAMDLRDKMNTAILPLASLGVVTLLPVIAGEDHLTIPYPIAPRGEKPYLEGDCGGNSSIMEPGDGGTGGGGTGSLPASLELQAKTTNPKVALSQVRKYLGELPKSLILKNKRGDQAGDPVGTILDRQAKVESYVQNALASLQNFDPTQHFHIPEVGTISTECQTVQQGSSGDPVDCARMMNDAIEGMSGRFQDMVDSWKRDVQGFFSKNDRGGVLASLDLQGNNVFGSTGPPDVNRESGFGAIFGEFDSLRSTFSCIANRCPLLRCFPTYCWEPTQTTKVRSALSRYTEIRETFLSAVRSYTQGVVMAGLERVQNRAEEMNQKDEKDSTPGVRANRFIGQVFKQFKSSCTDLQGIPDFPMVTLLHPRFYERQIVGGTAIALEDPTSLRISEAGPVPPPGVEPGRIVIKPGYGTRLRESEFPSRILPGFARFITAFTHH
jgi:hypothetical protein